MVGNNLFNHLALLILFYQKLSGVDLSKIGKMSDILLLVERLSSVINRQFNLKHVKSIIHKILNILPLLNFIFEQH